MIINRVYADCLVDARRFDEAIEQYKKTLELDPNFVTAHFFLGRAYEGKGMYDQAFAEYLKASEVAGFNNANLAEMRDAYTRGGWKAYLEATLKNTLERSQRGYTPPYVVASIYARLGRKDEAFAWLEKSFEQHDFRITLVSVSFEFDSLHSDPRFNQLLKRVGMS